MAKELAVVLPFEGNLIVTARKFMELDTAREAYNVGPSQTPASSSTVGFRSCEEIIESCGEDFKCKG